MGIAEFDQRDARAASSDHAHQFEPDREHDDEDGNDLEPAIVPRDRIETLVIAERMTIREWRHVQCRETGAAPVAPALAAR